MRPSSSSDPNAPHRATTPVLIDFFAKEAAEQQERTATARGQQDPFAELRPRASSSRYRPDSTADAGPSVDSPVTVRSLRSFLHAKGHSIGQHILDETIQGRLNAVNLSAETLLAALEITHTPDHAILRTLRVNQTERDYVVNKLEPISK